MLEQGIIPAIRLGRRWIITRHAYEHWERTCGAQSGTGLNRDTEVTVCELMAVNKRKYKSGKVAWYYQFAPPGSTRQNQNLITASGFKTKQEAIDAEAERRTQELVRQAATGGVAAPMPTTLSMLLAEFMKQHAEENLAPKTVERYHEMAAYIAPELLTMNISEIMPLHLSREWTGC